jgi:hypothetical protein
MQAFRSLIGFVMGEPAVAVGGVPGEDEGVRAALAVAAEFEPGRRPQRRC